MFSFWIFLESKKRIDVLGTFLRSCTNGTTLQLPPYQASPNESKLLPVTKTTHVNVAKDRFPPTCAYFLFWLVPDLTTLLVRLWSGNSASNRTKTSPNCPIPTENK